MAKAKIYKIDNSANRNNKEDAIRFIVGIVVYAFVLYITSSLFRHLYIENFWYAIIAALILSALNYTIKPILIYWTLPLSIVTYGIAYPIVNMIILKLCDLFMGNSFVISGFIPTFIIAIFISILKIIFDNFLHKGQRNSLL